MFKIKPDPSIRGQILSYFRGQFLPSPLKCRQPHTCCTHLPCPSPEMLLSRDTSQHPGDPVAIHSPTVTGSVGKLVLSVSPASAQDLAQPMVVRRMDNTVPT